MRISNLKWFDEGFFSFPRVPENTASGEIIIGSLYRELGLAYASEGEVGALSKQLKAKVKNGFHRNNIASPSGIPDEHLEYVFTKLVSSPLLKNQDPKKRQDYYFFSPIVPSFANYSSVARLVGRPWNPGGYIVKMIYRGAGIKAPAILNKLKDALSINEECASSGRDDVWSRFVNAEILSWESTTRNNKAELEKEDESIRLDIDFPSRRISSDIEHLVKLKSLMTRKRWISILEAYFRFALALDVLWICNIHRYFSIWLEKAYRDKSFSYVKEDLSQYTFFSTGQRRDDVIKFFTKEYAKHSLLNYGLYEFAKTKKVEVKSLVSIKSIHDFLASFTKKITKKDFEIQKKGILDYIDANSMEIITGKPGRTNNISEFLIYAPGRRNTAKESHASYDQGYWYKKAGTHKGAPWVFEMGPASLTTMVFLSCTFYGANTISVLDFIEFMKRYGIELNQKEVSSGVTGKHLRMLGLVIDSPDAEGGIVINQPFKVH